jgi:thiamine-monophosphate kinase
MTSTLEDALVARLTSGLPRSPLQLNRLNESDAELLRLPGTGTILAVTTDGIAEEIERGLYDDPFQIGWMTITVNASDLAAVGANPVGVLVSETLPTNADERLLTELQRGIGVACDTYGMPLLGGDTNFSSRLQTCATAIGTIAAGPILTRCGCKVGDRVFVSGPLGSGAAYAASRLMDNRPGPANGEAYLPRARLSEGRLLRRRATCCMDTSDGMIATCDHLMRLNGVGFEICVPAQDFLHDAAKQASSATGIPGWMLLAGPHGEFELLFTVSRESSSDFIRTARAHDWEPLEIGEVVAEPGLRIRDRGAHLKIQTAGVRDLFFDSSRTVEQYLSDLAQLGRPISL